MLTAMHGQAPEQLLHGQAGTVLVAFACQHGWQTQPEHLLAVFTGVGPAGWETVSVLSDTLAHRERLTAGADARQVLQALGVGWFARGQPVALSPVHIPKPWGEEIWFTGIEQRGISRAIPEHGEPLPLSWLLAAAPAYFQGGQAGQPPVLLKILAPWPTPGLGDLYLELHEQKREVYIITGIDPGAWPGGYGAIRYGVNPQARQAYPSDAAFREAFAQAAEAYEAHRREVDAWLDGQRRAAGQDPAQPADPAWLAQTLAGLPAGWQERETRLRGQLESFTALRPLAIGDVVQVPLRVPHSLQHGVRAVEFQTPVYERKILAFGQKVLTQPHWDSRAGAALMALETPPEPPLAVLENSPGCRREQVVRFDDFAVDRLQLAPGVACQAPSGACRLLMAVQGGLVAGKSRLGPEQAWLWPASVPLAVQASQPAENTVFLEAIPAPAG